MFPSASPTDALLAHLTLGEFGLGTLLFLLGLALGLVLASARSRVLDR